MSFTKHVRVIVCRSSLDTVLNRLEASGAVYGGNIRAGLQEQVRRQVYARIRSDLPVVHIYLCIRSIDRMDAKALKRSCKLWCRGIFRAKGFISDPLPEIQQVSPVKVTLVIDISRMNIDPVIFDGYTMRKAKI